MARNNKSQGTGMLQSSLIGVALSFFVCICLSLVCPVLLLNDSIDVKYLQMIVHITRGVATCLGVWIACLLALDRKLFTGMLCAVIWICLSVGCSVLFFHPDGFSVVSGVMATIAGAFIALAIYAKRGRSVKHKKRKR